VSYQPCRWYDPYPRLAFALKLLYLAPASLQAQAARQLQHYLLEEWGSPAAIQASPSATGQRWYDENQDTAAVMELLRESPDYLKTRAANELLKLLAQDSLA
jgi:4-alpha-glucanotransferase